MRKVIVAQILEDWLHCRIGRLMIGNQKALRSRHHLLGPLRSATALTSTATSEMKRTEDREQTVAAVEEKGTESNGSSTHGVEQIDECAVNQRPQSNGIRPDCKRSMNEILEDVCFADLLLRLIGQRQEESLREPTDKARLHIHPTKNHSLINTPRLLVMKKESQSSRTNQFGIGHFGRLAHVLADIRASVEYRRNTQKQHREGDCDQIEGVQDLQSDPK